MIRLAAKMIGLLSVATAVTTTPCAAQEGMLLSAPITPHPLDRNKDNQIAVAFFSFGPEIEDQIHRIDDDAADLLQSASGHESVEVFVILVENWKRAALANAGLIASLALRDELDAMAGSDDLLSLHDAPSNYSAYDKVLFALTEMNGVPVSEDCLVRGVHTALYEGVAEPTFDTAGCMDQSE